MFFALFVLTIVLLLLTGGAFGASDIHINSTSDLIDFSKNVNSGIAYLGVTVFLDADIDFSDDFSQQFKPIGNTTSKYFSGTYDGQGHTISNLEISSSSLYVGLFGYSSGTTIRNIVLDSSCSVLCSSKSGNPYIGGVIGHCSTSKQCIVENIVNMANISFTGHATDHLYIGGIIGCFTYSSYNATIKNCINYGTVQQFGESGGTYAYIGGIVGHFKDTSRKAGIYNCLNYGAVVHNKTQAGEAHVGGIAGYSSEVIVENCVSAGMVLSNQANAYMGTISGKAYISSTTIYHCFWTSNVGSYKDTSSGGAEESSLVTLNTTIVIKLNSYAEKKKSGWNNWLLNINNSTISFSSNRGNNITFDSQLVLFPTLAESDGHTFRGWFTDQYGTALFTSFDTSNTLSLYSGWSCALTLRLEDSSTEAKNVTNGLKYGNLSLTTKAGYTLEWFTEEGGKGRKITPETIVEADGSLTLYAHWTINNYKITFEFGNGTFVNVALKYNETIVYPMNLTREGYAFNGWNHRPERMPANDTTVVAQWIELQAEPDSNSSSSFSSFYSFSSSPPLSSSSRSSSLETPKNEYVEIIFDTKDMNREEIVDIIKDYTDEEFVIERFVVDNSTGETTVIIRFMDNEKAGEFVRKVNKYAKDSKNIIKSAKSVDTYPSFATTINLQFFIEAASMFLC